VEFFQWHKRQTDGWLKRLGMSYYAALWYAYLKGIVTALIAVWLMGYFYSLRFVSALFSFPSAPVLVVNGVALFKG
jgi:hypothetical protein